MNQKNAILYATVLIALIATAIFYINYQKKNMPLEQAEKIKQIQYTRLKTNNKLRGATSAEIDKEKFAPLRDIISDTSNPNLERAITAQYLADIFMLKTDRRFDFIKDHLFIGDPFVSFADNSIIDEDRRATAGIMRLYEMSLELNGRLPVSNYRLAEWELNRALEGNEPADQHAAKAKKYLEAGNEAFVKILGNSRLPTLIPAARWIKGVALTRLAELEKDAKLAEQAGLLFTTSIRELTSIQPPTEEGDAQLLWVRLQYAILLHEQLGNAGKEKISALLRDIANYPDFNDPKKQPGFFRYLIRLGKIEPAFFDLKKEKKSIQELAKFNSDFASMLKKLGWSI